VRALEAMTAERLADMTGQRDRWQQQAKADTPQIADQRDAGRAADARGEQQIHRGRQNWLALHALGANPFA
jgi:hypothetical protein